MVKKDSEGGEGLTSRVQVLWKFKLYADANLTVNEIYLLQCKKKKHQNYDT